MALFGIGLLLASTGSVEAAARDEVGQIVERIKRADYEGDRSALKKNYDVLDAFVANKELASRVRYWRGFALWRSAINGANDATADQNALEAELKQAIDEFKVAAASDPGFVDAKVGMINCLGFIAYFHRQENERMTELLGQIFPLVKELRTAAPDNPRFRWVMGPILWYTPADRGGGIDKAIANYQHALEVCSQVKPDADNLEPSWGQPELMMSLAYTYLQKSPPDVEAAERYARQALEAVPYWHYLRDILMPQIAAAKTKGS